MQEKGEAVPLHFDCGSPGNEKVFDMMKPERLIQRNKCNYGAFGNIGR
jgi:hypothetical protein